MTFYYKKNNAIEARRFVQANVNELALWVEDEWAMSGGKYALTSDFLTVYEDEDEEFRVYPGEYLLKEESGFRKLPEADFLEQYGRIEGAS